MRTAPRDWTGLVFIATSVDGYIAQPDGGLDWLTDPPAESRHAAAHAGEDAPPDYDAFTEGVSHLVMGRATYEKVLTFGFWPYEHFRTVVISTTLTPGRDERITVVASVDDACALLDEEHATQVYVDGGQVVTEFLGRGLIDELVISRAPVILGDGLPLFHRMPAETRLIHLGTSTTDSGMTTTRYRLAAR
ncbi:dihydrofolate reductase family protein [Nocardioides sp.]|uniref:dihydrofolate reductase family protein n=1 Tax=Nocardioides sp. TaxID=35761 RepID=UPI0035627A57